jgi:surfeit locus 1 family protein
MTLDRRDGAGLVVALLLAVGCVRLGVWQLDRLQHRRARNAALASARARPPVELREKLPLDSVRGRRVRARGVYDYAHERVAHGRSYEGVPGVDLVTPLRLADGRGGAVLVDRGWAPSPDGYHVEQGAYREPDSASVVGLGVVAPRWRGDVDPEQLGDSLPYRLEPFMVQQLPDSPRATRPGPALSLPRRWALPALSDGPHLSYAVQWFSFAAIIVVGSLALARSRAQAQRPRGTKNGRS